MWTHFGPNRFYNISNLRGNLGCYYFYIFVYMKISFFLSLTMAFGHGSYMRKEIQYLQISELCGFLYKKKSYNEIFYCVSGEKDLEGLPLQK